MRDRGAGEAPDGRSPQPERRDGEEARRGRDAISAFGFTSLAEAAILRDEETLHRPSSTASLSAGLASERADRLFATRRIAMASFD